MTQSTSVQRPGPLATMTTPAPEAGVTSAKADLRGRPLAEQEAALAPEPHPHGDHGVEHAPQPKGTGEASPARKDGDAVPADVRDPLIAKLKTIPASKEVLDAIDKAGKSSFPMKWSDAGTFHSAGTIFLRTTSTESSWLSSLAHELVHLQTFVEGKAANAKKQGRAEFVKAKMDDEINAQVTTFVALLQDGQETGSAAGFNEFVKFAKANHAGLITGQKWSELRTVAWAWIEGKYKTEWVTNNTKENYYDYWGNHWDKANGK